MKHLKNPLRCKMGKDRDGVWLQVTRNGYQWTAIEVKNPTEAREIINTLQTHFWMQSNLCAICGDETGNSVARICYNCNDHMG